MTEIVVAVFETPSSADAAAEDLTAARIPSAAVQRGGSDSALREDSSAVWHRNANPWQMPLVTVAVDEMYANAVTGILKQHGPVNVEVERPRAAAVSS
jgi:hypothetical protein